MVSISRIGRRRRISAKSALLTLTVGIVLLLLISILFNLSLSKKYNALVVGGYGNEKFTGVHVIQTRFMQYQPDMLQLGTARMKLFETFCLPTILAQTNRDFIWIIRADPKLHPQLRQEMADLLQGHPNFIFMGSNYNHYGSSFGGGNKSFADYILAENPKDKTSHTATSAEIWSGNITLLKNAYEQAQSSSEVVVLETRLDADDGLHRDFIQTIQTQATHYLTPFPPHGRSNNVALWRIWCVYSHVEWHPESPTTTSQDDDYGYLKSVRGGLCITPGLTLGIGPGSLTSRSNIKHMQHHQITNLIPSCDEKDYEKEKGCYKRMKSLKLGAIRSRTLTSVGMKDVVVSQSSGGKGHEKVDTEKQTQLWNDVVDGFVISRPTMKLTRQHVLDHAIDIAKENLASMCKPGTQQFSCKKDAKKALQTLIDPHDNRNTTL